MITVTAPVAGTLARFSKSKSSHSEMAVLDVVSEDSDFFYAPVLLWLYGDQTALPCGWVAFGVSVQNAASIIGFDGYVVAPWRLERVDQIAVNIIPAYEANP